MEYKLLFLQNIECYDSQVLVQFVKDSSCELIQGCQTIRTGFH